MATTKLTSAFPVRRQDFEFEQVPRYWVNGDAFMTHVFNGMSALFPDGAYSRPRLPLIPDEVCHPFHAKAATNSTAKLPPQQTA
ncbi:metal-dependent hydrolase [Marinobacter alkaliphilus]|uniref:metal-dependent hydrolase n=1 Tax=Marinobacter alkaliphilus TaxID=254719 RepID=UPI003D76717D